MFPIKIYSLRIVPLNPIYNEIVALKRMFIETFGNQKFSKSIPHITLATFEMDYGYQEFLLKAFNQLSNMKQFQLEINGFDVFENKTEVLFLKLAENEIINQILQNLKILWIRDLHRKYSSLNIPNLLHMTISNAKGKEMLYKSLDLFQEIDYYRQIQVNKLTLVSRYEGKTWDWEHHINLS
ncbi:2'-5' RNA ligase superfamily protein [Flaviramulus basaltis]|uniref:2'-5' RNA ligase superfamily protein n=1 Tax=Flaviramulus basaltis TaxID=369401 RepID=A0A1K2IGK7_9FLAO|nr:2'-5' RNA ligase family protein [Flaviramulus basaltis]SFZ91572.1 2'-5' RNA ligase superfamily protein [Flaviramulus basaltis]